ncbi:claudin i isoform X1 [Oryzias melastigma]|nr:claudin i isoform X1 [Oryzias melastigma]
MCSHQNNTHKYQLLYLMNSFFLRSSGKMGSSAVQMACVALGVLGLLGVVVACALPRWRVSSFIGSNIVTAQNSEEGLWMECVVQSTGQQQCKNYDSILVLPSDLQAARAMTIISCMLATLSLLIMFCGADFTTCVQNEDAKPKINLVGGVGLLLAGLLVIIPVSWSAHITVRDFNNPLIPATMKREMGACIYLGWAAGVLLLLAGGLLCCFSRPRSGGSGGTAKYYSNSAPATNKNYV